MRVDAEMTLHDSAMTRFGQWWKRAVRSGYGADGRGDPVRRERACSSSRCTSARWWAFDWPVLVLTFAVVGPLATWLIAMGSAAARPPRVAPGDRAGHGGDSVSALPLQMIRVALRVRKRVPDWRTALAYGFLTMIGKWANCRGQGQYLRDRGPAGTRG